MASLGAYAACVYLTCPNLIRVKRCSHKPTTLVAFLGPKRARRHRCRRLLVVPNGLNNPAPSQPGPFPTRPLPKPADAVDYRPAANPAVAGLTIDGAGEDAALARSDFLAPDEVIGRRRRLRHVNQLARYYRDQYWALVEDLRARYRRFYWDHGRSPFPDRGDHGDGDGGFCADVRDRGGSWCAFPACKSKAMALTKYCNPHILSDSKQKLYKPCISPVGQVGCGKPILRSSMPSLCTNHLQKHQKNIWRALKKGGLNMASSKKPPKFSIIVAEYVRQIQAKRREARDVMHTST